MAKKDDSILPSTADAGPVLELEPDEDSEPQASPRTITITTGEHKQIIAFLEHYGVDTDNMTPEEAFEKYERIQGLAQEQAQVLSRGATLDSFDLLLSHVPKGFKGEYIRDSPTEMDRARAMGWRPLESEEANQDSPTGKADGLVRIGDLVLFVIPDEEYAAKQIARDRRHADRRNRRKRELSRPSQGAKGVDPMGGKLGAHPDHPIRPLSELRG